MVGALSSNNLKDLKPVQYMRQQPMMQQAPMQKVYQAPPATMAPPTLPQDELNAPPGYKFAGYAPAPEAGENNPGWSYEHGKWLFTGLQAAPAPAQYMSAPQHPGGRPPVQYFGAPSHAPVMRHPSNAGARPVQYMQHQPIDARAKALKQLEAFEREEYLCPWWAKNGDVNSIAAVLFQTPERPPFRRERYETEDGGFFDVDFLESQASFSRGMVVVLHGLESCSTSPLAIRMSKASAAAGFDVAAVNFRGCSRNAAGEQAEVATVTMYNLGFTADVKWLLAKLHHDNPARRLYLSGFSLGGNVATKALGELGASARDLNVCGGAVGCPGFNLVNSAGIIDRSGFNRKVYAANFLKTMREKAARLHARFPAARKAFSLETLAKIDTLGELDDNIIAPLFGFKDRWDYYRQSDSLPYLPKIQVPHYLLVAADDPFFCPHTLPGAADVACGTVRIDYSPLGGHCGFVESGTLSLSSASILKRLFPSRPVPVGRAPNGYLADQLARMLEHLDASSGGPPTRAQREKSVGAHDLSLGTQPRRNTLQRPVRRMLGPSVLGATKLP